MTKLVYFFCVLNLFDLSYGYRIVLFHDLVTKEIKPVWMRYLDQFMDDVLVRYPYWEFKSVQVPSPIKRVLADRDILGAVILTRCQKANSLRSYIEKQAHLQREQVLVLAAELCKKEKQASQLPYNAFGYRDKLERWLNSIASRALKKQLVAFDKDPEQLEKTGNEAQREHNVLERDYIAVNPLQFVLRYLAGRHLTLATIEYPPIQRFVRDEQGKVVEYKGVTYDILRALADYYHFKYTLVLPPDNKLGSVENGTWNGVVGMAARGEVDFVAANLGMTYARYTAVDYVHMLTQTVVVILVPPPRFKDKSLASIDPFQFPVWVTLIASLLLSALALWIYSLIAWQFKFLFVAKDKLARRPVLSELILFFFRVLTCQASDYLNRLNATRLLICGFLAMAIILTNSYNSELISFITVPKLIPVVDSMEDMAERYPISLILQSFSASELILFGAERGVYKMLGDRVQNKREQFVDTQDEGISKVLTGRHGYFGGEAIFQYYIAQDYAKYKQCRFSLIYDKHELFKMTESFPIPKGSPLKEALSMKFMMLAEFGIVKLLHRRGIGSVRSIPCTSFRDSLPVSKSLFITDLLSAFVIIAAGHMVALVAFLGEILLTRWNVTNVIPVM